MALRQYRPNQYEEYPPKETQATYQAYQPKQPDNTRLKELLFFVNIAIFSILTVCATYCYLSFKLPTFIAFLLAIPTGLIGLTIVQKSIRTYFQYLRKKKYGR